MWYDQSPSKTEKLKQQMLQCLNKIFKTVLKSKIKKFSYFGQSYFYGGNLNTLGLDRFFFLFWHLEKQNLLMTETDLSHLVEGALDTVGQGHSGWTCVFVSLNKIINRPIQNTNIVHIRTNPKTDSTFRPKCSFAIQVSVWFEIIISLLPLFL